MSTIAITRQHRKDIRETRAAVERLAEKLADRFAVAHAWNGDSLTFERAGIHGEIILAAGEVRITAHLGFLFSAFRHSIEAEVHRYLDQELA